MRADGGAAVTQGDDTMFNIYDSDYDEMPGDFDSIEEAAVYILADLPHEDYAYMIGTGDGVDAIVFQGQVYYPEVSLGRASVLVAGRR